MHSVYMLKENASTPFMCIDAAAVRRNLSRLATYASEHGLKIRPHTKTHKSIQLAKAQLDAGAAGLTVAKVGEAETMIQAANGELDLLLAYPAVDPARTSRIAEVARGRTVRVAVDSRHAADALADAARTAGTTLGILVDLDVGMHRTGLQSPEDALALAQHVDQTQGLRLDGLFCYPGHVWPDANGDDPAYEEINNKLSQTIDLWRRSGLEAGIVSGGSTPTAYQSHRMPAFTEIRPGTYIFNDMNIAGSGWVPLEDCAARVVATVVSNAVPGQVVIDAGSKTLTREKSFRLPNGGHGHVVEYPQAVITTLSEEHGQIDITACDRAPKIGERVTIIPNHICPCINLQDVVWWDEGDGKLEAMRVDARGKLS